MWDAFWHSSEYPGMKPERYKKEEALLNQILMVYRQQSPNSRDYPALIVNPENCEWILKTNPLNPSSIDSLRYIPFGLGILYMTPL